MSDELMKYYSACFKTLNTLIEHLLYNSSYIASSSYPNVYFVLLIAHFTSLVVSFGSNLAVLYFQALAKYHFINCKLSKMRQQDLTRTKKFDHITPVFS